MPVSDLAIRVTDPDPDYWFDNQVVIEIDGVPFPDKDLEHIRGGDQCCGVSATVFRRGDLIGWRPPGDRWNHRLLPPTMYFDTEQYLFAEERAWDDRRWERPTRATARLVVEQLRAHDPLGAIAYAEASSNAGSLPTRHPPGCRSRGLRGV